MPRGSWLGFVFCLAVVTPAVSQGQGQAPPRTLPAYTPPPASPPTAGAPPLGEAPLRDLTPPEFTDLVPPPDPHAAHGNTPGCLTPTVPGHAGFYGTAEYLLFKARTGASDYAIVNSTGGLATAGPIQTLSYAQSSGVRAEGGYRFSAGWDVAFGYTYFLTDGNALTNAGPGQVLLPTLTRPGLTDNATSALASANLNYNLYDMMIGKRFAIDDHFAIRGFAGFRFAQINQRFSTLYNGLDANLAVVNSQSRFNGFGPMIGGEAILNFCRGFHGYARASGGLITGTSHNTLQETNDGGATIYANTQYNVRQVVPVSTIAIGGGWQYRTVSIRAGYEITQWFGLAEPTRFVDDVGQGKINTRSTNLSLEGFFIQFGLTF
ncbi:MAG: hypothetical protein K8U57_36900 [Planctomycetes bacterium]|nr:hypothetical protein [Planctomycetota bacterium]